MIEDEERTQECLAMIENPPKHQNPDDKRISSPLVEYYHQEIGNITNSTMRRNNSAPKSFNFYRRSFQKRKRILMHTCETTKFGYDKNRKNTHQYERSSRTFGPAHRNRILEISKRSSKDIQHRKISTGSCTTNLTHRTSTALEKRKERFESQFCQIQVLLISLQIGLGVAVALIGFRVTKSSKSINWIDCGGWAGFPLFIHGIMNVLFCSPLGHTMNFYRFMIGLRIYSVFSSFLLSVICFIASVVSGCHGNRISWYIDCPEVPYNYTQTHHSPNTNSNEPTFNNTLKNLDPKCLHRQILQPNVTCQIFLQKDNQLVEYSELECRILFTQVKDDLILQCSLMAVAGGACLWFACIQSCSKQSRIVYSILKPPVIVSNAYLNETVNDGVNYYSQRHHPHPYRRPSNQSETFFQCSHSDNPKSNYNCPESNPRRQAEHRQQKQHQGSCMYDNDVWINNSSSREKTMSTNIDCPINTSSRSFNQLLEITI